MEVKNTAMLLLLAGLGIHGFEISPPKCNVSVFLNYEGIPAGTGHGVASHPLVRLIEAEGRNCVEELSWGMIELKQALMTSENMIEVANRAARLARHIRIDGVPKTERQRRGHDAVVSSLFQFLEVGFDFEQDSYVQFNQSVRDEVQLALKEMLWTGVNATSAVELFMLPGNEGKGLIGAMKVMKAANMQHLHLDVVKEWLGFNWDRVHAESTVLKDIMFEVLEMVRIDNIRGRRGFVNQERAAIWSNSTELVDLLRKFVLQHHFVNTTSQPLLSFAGHILGSLYQPFKNDPIFETVEQALYDTLSLYNSTENGGTVWWATARTINRRDCGLFNTCRGAVYGYWYSLTDTVSRCTVPVAIQYDNETLTQEEVQRACLSVESMVAVYQQLNNVTDAEIREAFRVRNHYGELKTELAVSVFRNRDEHFAVLELRNHGHRIRTSYQPTTYYSFRTEQQFHPIFELERAVVHAIEGLMDKFKIVSSDFSNSWSDGLYLYSAILSSVESEQAVHSMVRYIHPELLDIGAILTTAGPAAVERLELQTGPNYDVLLSYLVVRFMYEKHMEDVVGMREAVSSRNATSFKAKVESWGAYNSEFQMWVGGL